MVYAPLFGPSGGNRWPMGPGDERTNARTHERTDEQTEKNSGWGGPPLRLARRYAGEFEKHSAQGDRTARATLSPPLLQSIRYVGTVLYVMSSHILSGLCYFGSENQLLICNVLYIGGEALVPHRRNHDMVFL